MHEPTNRWRGLDSFAPLLAMAGLAGSLVPDYLRVRTWEVPGTDFKTVFASVRLFAQHQDPYAATLIHQMFSTSGVIQPAQWFGHAAVYPPFTLTLLLPFASLNMAAATWIWFILSAVLMAVALGALLRWSRDELLLPPWMRVAVLAICVACPLLGYGLEIGNVSTATAALCLFAFCERRGIALRAIALALALLLKPHMAIWLCLAMLFAAETSRTIALWSAGIAAGFVTVTSFVLLLQHRLGAIWTGFLHAVMAESLPGGSNSPASRETLPIGAQFSAAWSIPAYWPDIFWLKGVTVALLACCAAAACWTVLQVRREAPASSSHTAAMQGLLACTWMAFGMSVIYHRQHDAQMLLLFIPVAAFLFLDTQARVWTTAALVLLVGTWIELPVAGKLQPRQAGIFSFLFAAYCGLFAAFLAKRAKKSRYRR